MKKEIKINKKLAEELERMANAQGLSIDAFLLQGVLHHSKRGCVTPLKNKIKITK